MNLESSASAMELIVITQEEDKNRMRRYRRLDNGKIISYNCIEFLQEPSILVSHDGKSSTNIITSAMNFYVRDNANAIVLGQKLTHHNIYSASFCRARL
jgi:hypothetical protein